MNGAEVADSRLNSLPFALANRADIGGGNDQEIEGKFAIDSLKNWDFAKTDFSDRFVEGFEEPMFVFEDSWMRTFDLICTGKLKIKRYCRTNSSQSQLVTSGSKKWYLKQVRSYIPTARLQTVIDCTSHEREKWFQLEHLRWACRFCQ